jgi:hypothetical protein
MARACGRQGTGGQGLEVSWNPAAKIPVAPCTMVIGVAEDAAHQSLTDEQRFMYYLNVDQMGSGWASRVLVRLTGRPTAYEMDRVRVAMLTAMPGDGFVVLRPLQEVIDDQAEAGDWAQPLRGVWRVGGRRAPSACAG